MQHDVIVAINERCWSKATTRWSNNREGGSWCINGFPPLVARYQSWIFQRCLLRLMVQKEICEDSMSHFSTADEDLGLNSRQFLWGDHKQPMNFTPSTTFTKEQVTSINPTFHLDIFGPFKRHQQNACQSCRWINLISGSFKLNSSFPFQGKLSVIFWHWKYYPPWEHFPSLGIQGMYGSMIFQGFRRWDPAIRNGHVIRTEGESLEKYHLVSAEAEAFLSPRCVSLCQKDLSI